MVSLIDKSKVDEIEITPEMLEAGMDALGVSDLENLPREAVCAIYRAMWAVAMARASQRLGNADEQKP